MWRQALGGYRQRIEFSHDCVHANITVMGKTLEAATLQLAVVCLPCFKLSFSGSKPKFNSWKLFIRKFSCQRFPDLSWMLESTVGPVGAVFGI